MRIVLGGENRLLRSLKPLGQKLFKAQTSVVGCRMVSAKEAKEIIESTDRCAALRLLASKTEGLFILRLRDGGQVDRAFVLDGNRGSIAESEEPHALFLSAYTP